MRTLLLLAVALTVACSDERARNVGVSFNYPDTLCRMWWRTGYTVDDALYEFNVDSDKVCALPFETWATLRIVNVPPFPYAVMVTDYE